MSKDPRPWGVYIHSSAANVSVRDSAIIHMIRECDVDVFEACLSINQDLTFQYAKEEFAKKGFPL